ncbi:MAG: DUF3473 domain-containing protein [Pirellulales bacterium]|nr:DUF3473 domain-containing protein [Pirellulales bacterium]
MKNALTIDVEDYYHVQAFADVIQRSEWDNWPSRIERNTHHILEILHKHDVRATFFVLGWIADRFPDLIRAIFAGGHEIASHGYWHQLVYELNVDTLESDLLLSRGAIHKADPNIIVRGYRAPSFSITPESEWALDILQKLGFEYDSSIFPFGGHDCYGFPGASRFVYQARPKLLEIPVSTVCLLKRNVPVAGGGYFRFYPFWVNLWAIRRINREGYPAVVYLHPWELDPGQPRIKEAKIKSKFRHYLNLHRSEDRFHRLLEQLHFGSIDDVYADHLAGLGVC